MVKDIVLLCTMNIVKSLPLYLESPMVYQYLCTYMGVCHCMYVCVGGGGGGDVLVSEHTLAGLCLSGVTFILLGS